MKPALINLSLPLSKTPHPLMVVGWAPPLLLVLERKGGILVSIYIKISVINPWFWNLMLLLDVVLWALPPQKVTELRKTVGDARKAARRMHATI